MTTDEFLPSTRLSSLGHEDLPSLSVKKRLGTSSNFVRSNVKQSKPLMQMENYKLGLKSRELVKRTNVMQAIDKLQCNEKRQVLGSASFGLSRSRGIGTASLSVPDCSKSVDPGLSSWYTPRDRDNPNFVLRTLEQKVQTTRFFDHGMAHSSR